MTPYQPSISTRENHTRVYSPVDFDADKCLPPELRKYQDDEHSLALDLWLVVQPRCHRQQ